LKQVHDKEINDLVNRIVVSIVELPTQSTDSIREVRKRFSRELAHRPAEQILQLALKLRSRDDFILRFVAYELVHYHKAALASLNARSLKELGQGLDSWMAVDTFACYLSGPAWRERQVPDATVKEWTRSTDRWWRRAALVSTVPLNSKARGGKGDPSRTIDICSELVSDRDDMVVKALSWALRELSKRDPVLTKSFLEKYQDELAPRVIREVTSKLETGLKSARRSTRESTEKV
jgi:3-methyladenine DNA glycosylase AlkD